MKNNKSKLLLNYTILFCVVAFITFSFFLIFNKSLIHQTSDGVLQHYPNLVRLRRLLSELVHGHGFSFWSDDVALGGDTIGNLSMLTLCDPFSYIAAIFPIKYIDIGFGIAIVLRLYCAGLSMLGFIRYRGFASEKCLLAGISYAFCTWGIGAMRHPFFLLPMILFPLIIWGIEKVIKKESPFLLIAGVGFSLFSSIYFSYMTGIMALIYVIVRYFTLEESKNAISFLKLILKFLGYIIISCCLAAPFLVLTVFALLKCNMTSGYESNMFLTIRQLLMYIPSLLTKSEVFGNFSYTSVNALFTLLIPFAISGLKYKQKRVPCVMFLFSFVAIAFPFWGSLMNAFKYPVGRWCYCFAFFFVWMGIEQWETFQTMSSRMRRICTIWLGSLFGLVLLLGMIFRVVSGQDMALAFYELAFMAILLVKNKMLLRRVIVIVSLNIGIGYCIRFSVFGYDGKSAVAEFAGIGECYEKYENSVLRGVSGIKDKDFFRVDYAEHIGMSGDKYVVTTLPANESVYWNTKTISGYYSTIEDEIFEYNRQVLNSQNYCRRVSVFGNDNRSRLNFLQGVKYYLNEKENQNKEVDTEKYAGYGFSPYKTKNSVKIKKSLYNAGLGYVMPKVISEEEYEKLSPLKCEQTMMQAAVLNNKDIEQAKVKELVAEQTQLQYEDKEIGYEISDKTSVVWKGNNTFDVMGENNAVYLSVPELENVELYVEFKNLKHVPYSYEEQSEMQKDSLNKVSVYEKRLKMFSSLVTGKLTDEFNFSVGLGDIKKYVSYLSSQAMGLTTQSDFMTNIGYFNSVKGNISLNFLAEGHYSYDSLKVYALSQNNFDIQASQLSNNRFTTTEVQDDYIKGNINSLYDGWLYLNLVYNPGWKVYVDGEEKSLTRTDTCFSGLPVTSGNHEIVLKYYPKELNYCLGAFIIGVLVCIGIFILRKYRKKS